MRYRLEAIFVNLLFGDALVKKIVEKILSLETVSPFFVKYFSPSPAKFFIFIVCVLDFECNDNERSTEYFRPKIKFRQQKHLTDKDKNSREKVK